MSLFSSTRRRLWLWTLAVVAAIASSLWVGGQLADALRDLNALEEALSVGLFLLGMLLVGVTAVLQGVWARPGRLELVVAAGIAAVYLLVFLRIAVLEERSHLIEYGVRVRLRALEERVARAGASPCRQWWPSWRRRRWACSTCSTGRAQPRLRPVGHPLQRAGGGAGGWGERRAGVGAGEGEGMRNGAGLGNQY